MLNLNSVMIGTHQPQELAAFYQQVIGKPTDMVDGEQGFWGWQVETAFFSILKHSEMGGAAKDPGRIMLNFETAQVKDDASLLLKSPAGGAACPPRAASAAKPSARGAAPGPASSRARRAYWRSFERHEEE